MKAVLALLLLMGPAFAQSPFDGTWTLDPPVPQRPVEYSLVHGVFHSSE
jgi:hypothetical protein